MNHLQEKHIEQYLLRDNTLDEGVRQHIHSHLSECDECRKIYDELRTFYRELDATASPPRQQVQQLTQSILTSPFKERLHPVKESLVDTSSFVLAAKTQDSQPHRFQRIVNFGSNRFSTLVRILYDQQEDVLLFYLMADDPKVSRHALIRLPGIHRELITDTEGKAELHQPDETWFSQIQKGELYVHFPMDEFAIRLPDAEPNTISQKSDLFSLTIRGDRQTVTFEIHPKDTRTDYPRRLLIIPDSSEPILITLIDGIGHINKTQLRSPKFGVKLFE